MNVTMHDLDNSEALSNFTSPLDMEEITRLAKMRRFRLEFLCDGAVFYWAGKASDQTEAVRLARIDLAINHYDFNEAAQLMACIETGS